MEPALAFPPEPETRRMHEAVRSHWQSVKENRMFPRVEEIVPEALKEAWPWCFIVDMRKAPKTYGFNYSHMGQALKETYGMDMMSIAQCNTANAPHIGSMLRHFGEVAESGEPAMDESEFVNMHGERLRYRCSLMPLGRADAVEHILGCMRWKAY